jgi:parvulin-like peptidyl-prolyl isomerase
VVETDFGYHIIQLTDVRGGEKKPFDAVRAEIEDRVAQAAGAEALRRGWPNSSPTWSTNSPTACSR